MKDLKFYLLGIVALLCCISADAQVYEFTEGYLRYKIDLDKSTTDATVTGHTDAMPNDVVIPATVSYKGQTFNVTTIGGGAFQYCTSLTSIDFGNVTTIEDGYYDNYYYGAFYKCTSLTSIDLKIVTTIGSYAFRGCSSLTSIDFKNVSTIKDFAFKECWSLVSIDLKNVKVIFNYAFLGCNKISEVRTLETKVQFISDESFEDVVFRHAKLFVPKGSKQYYIQHPVWGLFINIEEYDVNAQPIYLTIKYAESGDIVQIAENGKTYYFKINSSEGWKINTVTFNGTDVTTLLDENNGFTTPAITEDAILNVSFESLDNAITDVLSNNISVRGYNGNIFVEGVDNGGIINVYTVDGSLIGLHKANGSCVQIAVDSNNIYIVKVGGRTFKLAL